MKKMKLFCLAYAGGSCSIYEGWKKYIHPYIEVVPVEYSGRGKRFSESLYTNINDLTEDIYNTIKSELNEMPYAFLGHSMGSLVAYELAYKIKENHENDPMHIFFSGKSAPNIIKTEKVLHTLNDNEFKKEILKLNGTPKEVLENKELMDIFLPVLRADFKANEEYEYNGKRDKLDCDFTVLYGKEEDIEINEIIEWKNHTKCSCNFFQLNGGHFFINSEFENVTKIINSILMAKI